MALTIWIYSSSSGSWRGRRMAATGRRRSCWSSGRIRPRGGRRRSWAWHGSTNLLTWWRWNIKLPATVCWTQHVGDKEERETVDKFTFCRQLTKKYRNLLIFYSFWPYTTYWCCIHFDPIQPLSCYVHETRCSVCDRTVILSCCTSCALFLLS